jgi:MFS family permease
MSRYSRRRFIISPHRGVGAAMPVFNSLAIPRAPFEGDERWQLGSGFGVWQALGPLLGAVLAGGHSGWRDLS